MLATRNAGTDARSYFGKIANEFTAMPVAPRTPRNLSALMIDDNFLPESHDIETE
ncbi:hypothetical protein [Pseudoalteromonas pernae]|uniref:hypothetical protein n=1 Tax=Pseudoalteromonas pernae TaxID=3118054 RepID=UPI003241E28D